MRDKTLTLSVIIPTYNEEDYIAACLDAIAAQTEMPDEVIVVDNNSSDSTVKIAKQYSFVTVLKESEQGVRFARNTGFNRVKNDLIGRIDADTRLSADWCKRARELFAKNQTIAAATGPCSYYDMPLQRVGLSLDNAVRRTVFMLGDMPVLYGSNMVLRTTAWHAIRGDVCMGGEIYEDYDISIHLADNDLTTLYDQRLICGVSARRLDDDPRSFARNMRLHTHTYAVHGLTSKLGRAGQIVYLAVYPPMKVLRKLYSPEERRLSLKKALKEKTTARPDSRNY